MVLAAFANGVGTMAQFFYPEQVAISSDGVFALVSDSSNQRFRLITMATGVVSTLAGSGANARVDGIGTAASFVGPGGVSISPDNSFAIVLSYGSSSVIYIDIATGVVRTLAGGSSNGNSDGAGTAASFQAPAGIAVSADASGTFALVADGGNNRIRRVTISNGMVTTLAGSTEGHVDAAGVSAKLRVYRPSFVIRPGSLSHQMARLRSWLIMQIIVFAVW